MPISLKIICYIILLPLDLDGLYLAKDVAIKNKNMSKDFRRTLLDYIDVKIQRKIMNENKTTFIEFLFLIGVQIIGFIIGLIPLRFMIIFSCSVGNLEELKSDILKKSSEVEAKKYLDLIDKRIKKLEKIHEGK